MVLCSMGSLLFWYAAATTSTGVTPATSGRGVGWTGRTGRPTRPCLGRRLSAAAGRHHSAAIGPVKRAERSKRINDRKSDLPRRQFRSPRRLIFQRPNPVERRMPQTGVDATCRPSCPSARQKVQRCPAWRAPRPAPRDRRGGLRTSVASDKGRRARGRGSKPGL